MVENLLGPQELLNKSSSQELHVINTTANSGWKLKHNALRNMSVAELEQRGAQTGLVLELEDIGDAEKIQPNQVPTGLDRVSGKAEEHIKGISGVSDYMQGFAREDVSSKSVIANQRSGFTNLVKVMDNLIRTDHLLARNILDMVQEFYTEERIVTITKDRLSGETEQVEVNTPTAAGVIKNDLTVGNYAITITHEPERDSMEDMQFQQALNLRTEAGIPIPDRYIIETSRLRDKRQIVQAIGDEQDSPLAQRRQALAIREKEAEIAEREAKAAQQMADAKLKQAKTSGEVAETAARPELSEAVNQSQENRIEAEQNQREHDFKVRQLEAEMEIKREQLEIERARLEQEEVKQRTEAVQRAQELQQEEQENAT